MADHAMDFDEIQSLVQMNDELRGKCDDFETRFCNLKVDSQRLEEESGRLRKASEAFAAENEAQKQALRKRVRSPNMPDTPSVTRRPALQCSYSASFMPTGMVCDCCAQTRSGPADFPRFEFGRD